MTAPPEKRESLAALREALPPGAEPLNADDRRVLIDALCVEEGLHSDYAPVTIWRRELRVLVAAADAAVALLAWVDAMNELGRIERRSYGTEAAVSVKHRDAIRAWERESE